ncbi:MAG: hypothetical protein QXP42_06015 [Candidatus Micrarchaeia archaeon]
MPKAPESGFVKAKKTPTRATKNCPPGSEFVFVNPGVGTVGKAKNLQEFAELIKSAPLQSVLYHANGGHFTPWLEMMGEKTLASNIGAIRGNGEQVRRAILKAIETY